MRYIAPVNINNTANISGKYVAPVNPLVTANDANPNITAALNYLTPKGLPQNTAARADSLLQNIGGELSGLTKSSSGVAGLMFPQLAQQMDQNPTSIVQNQLETTMGIPPALLQKMMMGEGALPDIQAQQSPSDLSKLGNILKSGGAGAIHSLFGTGGPETMAQSLTSIPGMNDELHTVGILPESSLNVPKTKLNKESYKVGEYIPPILSLLGGATGLLRGDVGTESELKLPTSESELPKNYSKLEKPLGINPKAVGISSQKVINDGQKLIKNYEKGYDILENKVGDKSLIPENEAKQPHNLATIFNKNNVRQFPANLRTQLFGEDPSLREGLKEAEPDYTAAVTQRIDPVTLGKFKSEFGNNKLLINSFDNFAHNPTGKNTGQILRTLSAHKTGKPEDYLRDRLLGDMRDQIRDNIASPNVGRLLSKKDADDYSMADMNFHQYMKRYGNDSELDKLVNNRIHPDSLSKERYFNMLENGRENGNFERGSVPDQEFHNMRKYITPGKLKKSTKAAANVIGRGLPAYEIWKHLF